MQAAARRADTASVRDAGASGKGAARLAAMQAAEHNIEDHIEGMNAGYRRKRQDSITEDLLNIVAGFEALETAENHT